MKHFFLALLLVATACSMATPLSPSAPAATATVAASATPEPTAPPTSTATPAPTATPEPTRLPKPYLIQYYRGVGDGVDEIAVCLSYHPSFILFEDGQLIMDRGDGWVETKLTTSEVKGLLQQIKDTGFFEIEATDEEIYNLPEGYEFNDGGWSEGLEVQGQSIWVNPAVAKYAVKAVQDAFTIIANYQPVSVPKRFIPEQAYLFIVDASDGYFPLPDPMPVLLEWPKSLPPLQLSWGETTWNKDVIKVALELKLVHKFPSVELFSQNGINFFVVACPYLY